MKRLKMYWRKGNTLQVFSYAPTANLKVSNTNKAIIQHYSYSKEQFEFLKNGGKCTDMFQFDKDVCFNCPFSKNAGYKMGKCYTHKFPQARGFAAMIRSIKENWNDIPTMPEKCPEKLLKLSSGRFIRFGTYGETVLIPLKWVEQLTTVAKNWTGYTHQWHKTEFQDYKKYFMASVHMFEQRIAQDMEWRCFNITSTNDKIFSSKNVICPANTEKNIACNSCSLCSGTNGRGKYSVQIKYH